jgi:hypothetical protein
MRTKPALIVAAQKIDDFLASNRPAKSGAWQRHATLD